MPLPTNPCLAIVGATGAVGVEMLRVLEDRRFPHAELKLFASPRSAGTSLTYRNEPHTVIGLPDDPDALAAAFRGVHCALFSAGSSISRKIGPVLARRGVAVVDNSSAFRMEPGVPLVTPEVNPDDLRMQNAYAGSDGDGGSGGAGGIYANPNCSTIIMLVAVNPLRKAFGVERLVISTYQAASGAGAKAMEELREQTQHVLAGREPTPVIFPEPYAFNLFSHNSAMDPATGLNQEEAKMIHESRKMWHDDSVQITATCIRVPVMRAHAESINVTLKTPATLAQVRAALESAPGLTLVDDRASNRFPTPLKASGKDNVLVGRLRADPSQLPPGANPGADTPTRGFDLFVCGDQLRKGAALNAVQIAELL
jgi:aspartate-semialdehyde dehydrogenase